MSFYNKKKLTPNSSEAEKLAALPAAKRQEILSRFTPEQLEALEYDWNFLGRKNQFVPEGDWHIFAICAGRGFGKTLALSQWVRYVALTYPGCRIGIAGRTSADVRDTIVMGESGILAVHHPDERPEYKPSTRRLDWSNGSEALLISAESPDQARGPQFNFFVADEYAAWPTKPDASGATLWTNALAATRLTYTRGKKTQRPQIFIATTPKRTDAMKRLIEDSKDPRKKTVIITGSTLDNKNLSKDYIDGLLIQYEGSPDLARQEIEGQMLDSAQGLVFTDDLFSTNRIRDQRPPETPLRIVAVDPTVAAEPRDECGIVVIGATQERDLHKRRAYVLQDYSLKAKPEDWAAEVVKACEDWDTKFVVIEKNQGGDLVRHVIHQLDPTLKIFLVSATKNKQTRAEPVVLAMQQKRVKFWHDHQELEDQCVFYDPSLKQSSPDRMDAFVWGITATLIAPPEGLRISHTSIHTAAGRKLPTGRGTGRARPFKRQSGR